MHLGPGSCNVWLLANPPTPAEERGSAPGITGVGGLTMDAGACESLVARSVPVLRFTGYGWARMYSFFFLGIQTQRLAPNVRAVESVLE